MTNEQEYLMLRDEITWRLKIIDTMSAFTYTSFSSIIGIALSTNVIELFLILHVVIILVSLKVANHKYTIGHIVAYLNVFLEGLDDKRDFKWERMHVNYYIINPRTLKENVIFYGSSMEYILMCLLSSVIFWIKYNLQYEIHLSTLQISGYIVIQLFALFLVTYITFSYVSFQKIKPSIVDQWKKVKDKLL